MNEIKLQGRQGDVFIERISDAPDMGEEIARDGGRVILEYGEVTGHAHAISDAGAQTFKGDASKILRVLEGGAVALRHEEHSAFKIPPGLFRVTRQREYSPEGLRNVQD